MNPISDTPRPAGSLVFTLPSGVALGGRILPADGGARRSTPQSAESTPDVVVGMMRRRGGAIDLSPRI